VSFQYDPEPLPVFHRFSRRVPLEEVAGSAAPEANPTDPDE
jgi:hypothetical protein